MKKITTLALGTLLSFNASALSVKDFSYDTLQLVEYDPSSLSVYEFDTNAEKIHFNGFEAYATPEYLDAKEYLDRQTYLNSYQSKVYDKVLFSTAYLIQNAESPEEIEKFSKTSNFVDLCAYFAVNQEAVYVIEAMLTKSLKADEFKDRFIETHAHITKNTYDEYMKEAPEAMPYCAAFVGLNDIPEHLVK